jgi:hypothetical protein
MVPLREFGVRHHFRKRESNNQMIPVSRAVSDTEFCRQIFPDGPHLDASEASV